MGIWDFWKTQAADYVYGALAAPQGPAGISNAPLVKDAVYVQVKLRRMWIVNARVATKRFYGAVHGDLGLWHDSGRFINFKQLIAPPELKNQPASRLDRAVVSNQPLLGPTPYRGGPIQLNAALLSVKFADLAGPFLDVLSGLADAAGVSYIKAAEPFLKPLSAGIDLLTGTPNASVLEIQVVTNLDAPETGVYVVLRAPRDKLDIRSIRVAEDYSLTQANGAPIHQFPYMVITIEASQEREDWKGIPDIKAAYDQVVDAVKKDDAKGYQEALTVFRRTTWLSDDLLPHHARELYSQVKSKMDELMGAPLTAARARPRQPPTLDAYNPFRSGW
jgi:hypothetical protein